MSVPVVVIPAYQPDATLAGLVDELLAAGFSTILVIDDGSSATTPDPFAFCTRPGVVLVRHASNRGKGAALKTGLAHWVRHFPGSPGVITVDADGQHLARDVQSVAEAFARAPQSLVLGSRKFDSPDVPRFSRWGNALSHRALRWATGRDLPDTQTGLRALPPAVIQDALELTQNGYDFEFALLIEAIRKGVEVQTAPIATRYLPANASSHFRPLQDSLRVAWVLSTILPRRPRRK